jgi:hypothetical protein
MAPVGTCPCQRGGGASRHRQVLQAPQWGLKCPRDLFALESGLVLCEPCRGVVPRAHARGGRLKPTALRCSVWPGRCRTRFTHCVRYAQSSAASQTLMRAARAPAQPCAPQRLSNRPGAYPAPGRVERWHDWRRKPPVTEAAFS